MTTRNDHGQTLATLNQNLNFPLQFAVLDFGLAVRSGGWKHEWKAGKGYGMGAAWVGWAGERCEMLGEVMWEMLCELFFCEILSCLSRYWHDRTLMPDTLTLAEGYHINEHVKLPGSVKCPALGQLVSCAYIISTSKRKHSKRLNFSSFPGAKWVSMFFFNPVGSSEKKNTWKSPTGLITDTECFKANPISQGRNIAGDPRYFAPSAWMQLTHGYRQIVMLSWPRKGGGKKSREVLCERFALAWKMDMFWGRWRG